MCFPKAGDPERWVNDVFHGSVYISRSFVGRGCGKSYKMRESNLVSLAKGCKISRH